MDYPSPRLACLRASVAFLLLALAFLLSAARAASLPVVTVTVTGHPVRAFSALQAFGAGVDGLEQGDAAQVYTPANVKAMRAVPYGPLTYRLRTELAIDAWHWNPRGAWSDAARGQGYWTSDARAASPLLASYGYRLPRRGSTTDQAANDGYSRLDDGDPRTFWKSNPYLSSRFTHEPDSLHPQWVVMDLGRPRLVNALRVLWGVPYATQFHADYWRGPDDPNDGIAQTQDENGAWLPFPQGQFASGKGGAVTLRLCARTVRARFVRLTLTGSSGTAPRGSIDARDRLGYAIRELGAGLVDTRGRWHDWVRRAPRHDAQTEMVASSTDPFYAATDRDPRVEQPGFDRVWASGLTHGLPVLVPVGVLYDTPDNAASELRFLKQRGYALRGVELGEEPDGQYVSPEDYGALYVQFADALRRVDKSVPLGGPSLQTDTGGWHAWPDTRGNHSWVNRFLRYLKQRGRLGDFGFLSWEWYPFDDVCAPPALFLKQEPTLLAACIAGFDQAGLPPSVPLVITEYGYSAFAGQPEMDLPGALLDADCAAQFLTLGGQTAFLYGLEPDAPMHESPACPTWGNLALFLSNSARRIRCPLPAYWAEQMLAREWVGPGRNALYRAAVMGAAGTVTAYALRRATGDWAVLLLNKDPHRAQTIRLRLQDSVTGRVRSLRGPLTVIQYGPAQFVWHADGAHGFPTRNLPPARFLSTAATLRLPPYSLTVARGR